MAEWTCGACGRANPAGTSFCGHCGTAAAAAWECAACAAENPPETRFCGHCGTPRAASASPQRLHAPAPPSPLAEPEPEVAQTLRSFVATQVADRLVEAGGTLPEERRLITALFADVSGFTTLADRLDTEELLLVIDPVIATLSSVVARYEGYVEKFAGDALLALFGAPVAHEDDAQRALHVALEMHAELARVCAELGPHASGLTLHVGVNSGHGIARVLGSEARMDYAVLGDSVILAQRLESAAPPGQTYVSELTRRLTAGDFEFESVGDLTLKGKLEPVPAFRLVGVRVARASARAASAAPLVGRVAELRRVEEALASLARHIGGVLSVTGEAGTGKSRLAEEARARAGRLGVRWLETRCLSYGAELAYRPYTDLLRSLTDDGDRDALDALLPAHARDDAGVFARLLELPGAGDAAELEPEAFRRRLHDAFPRLLASLGGGQPTVVAIDDMHWIDRSSLELTAAVARLSRDRPLLLWLAARPEAAPLVAEVATAADCTPAYLALDPLDVGDLADLLAGMLGGEPPADLVSFVSERSGGNPFFAGEMVRSLEETGALTTAEGRWRLRPGWRGDEVPPTVEGVLASRIDLLPRDAATLLGTAAVIGRRVPAALLAEVAAEPEVNALVDRLAASGFVSRADGGRDDEVVFAHALVQDVAYGRLLRRRRRDLHRRVAEVAERLYGAADESIDLLARHHYLGETGPRAVDVLQRAADRARRLFANREAIAHLERAAEVAEAHPALADELAEILLALADVHELVGDYERALQLYEDVRARSDDVRAWRGIAGTLRKQGAYAQALEVVEDSFRAPGLARSDLGPLWLEQGWTLMASGRYEQAVDVLSAGLTARGDVRDAVTGQMLMQLARMAAATAEPEAALRLAQEADELFAALGELRGMASSARVLGAALRHLDRLDEAAVQLERGLELAERVGNVEEIGGCLINLGLVEQDLGRLDDAIERDRRAIAEFERVGHASGRSHGYANLADKLTAAGRLDEGRTLCEQALAFAGSIGHSAVADVMDTLATISLRQGRPEEALAHAERAADLYLEMGAADGAAQALGTAAAAAERAGDASRARSVRERAAALGESALPA